MLAGFLSLLNKAGRQAAPQDIIAARSKIPDAGHAKLYRPRRARRGLTVGPERPQRGDGHYVPQQTLDQFWGPRLGQSRAQQRYLAEVNDYAKNFLRLVERNIVGHQGVLFENRAVGADGETPDKALNDELEAAWQAWGQRGVCTACGEYSWLDVQRLLARQTARDGEILIRELVGWPNNEFGYAIELISGDRLDERRNGELRRGFKTRLGVERGAWQRRSGYWLRTEQAELEGGRSEWVPADNIIHLYYPEDNAQSRGIPWADSTTRRLRMLGSYEGHALTAAHAGASKMGFYKEDEEGSYTDRDKLDERMEQLVDVLTEGAIEILPPGVTFESFDPGYPDGDLPPFLKAMLRGSSVGSGVSYNLYAGDLEGVNMSSLRHGLNDERDGWKILQGWLIDWAHTRVQRNWMAQTLLRQRVARPVASLARIYRPEWFPRRWPWVDPLNETKAADLEVAMGINSRTRLAGDRGRDFRQVMDEQAAENAYAADKGIALGGAEMAPETDGTTNEPAA